MRRFALLLGVALSFITTSAVAQNCDGFTDVLASSPFCPDVTWLTTYGITKGCAASQFCPNRKRHSAADGGVHASAGQKPGVREWR